MVLADLVPSAVLWRRDEIPDEGLDLLVAAVRVEAVEEDHATGVFHQLVREALAQGGVLVDSLPSAPAGNKGSGRWSAHFSIIMVSYHIFCALLRSVVLFERSWNPKRVPSVLAWQVIMYICR